MRGPYAEGVLSLIWQTDIPYGFEHNGLPVPGFGIGGRFGYRVTKTLGVEGLLEYARISNSGTVTQIHTTDKNGDGTLSGGENFFHTGDALYNLQSIRFGPGLRLMSGGLKDRVFGTFGFGGLYEFLDLDHVNLQWVETAKTYVTEGTFHHDYNGWSPYMLAELGYEYSAGDLLIGGAMSLTIESVSGIEGEPYDEPVQARLGFSLRVGYSAWSRAEEAR